MSGLFSRRRLIAAGGAAAIAAPLAMPSTANAAAPGNVLRTLISPVRVFDSRQSGSVLGGRKFRSGDVVAVAVSAAYQGDDIAEAVFVNITITETEGLGFLSVRGSDGSGELPPPTTSNINWSVDGFTLANLALSTVGLENSIEIHCLGVGQAHVIVDVQGYVPFIAA
ncbi:MAG TPA: hypothetical protein VMM60_06015 [Ilumatobacter sp.]|nr:hypothetical protein [Ilumatobacter sp.]